MNKLIIAIIALFYSGLSMAESMVVTQVLAQSHKKDFSDCDNALRSYFETLPFQFDSPPQVTVRPKFIEKKNETTGRVERYRLQDPEIQVVVSSNNPNNDETSFVEVGIQKRGNYCIFRRATTLLSGENPSGCDDDKRMPGTAVGKFYWRTSKNNPDLGDNIICVDINTSLNNSGKTEVSFILEHGQKITQFPADEAKK